MLLYERFARGVLERSDGEQVRDGDWFLLELAFIHGGEQAARPVGPAGERGLGGVAELAGEAGVKVEQLAQKHEWLILVCGHYEGIDQRVIDGWIDEEISIGDYVLTGGEIPAMVLIDAVVRQIPGVLGREESFAEESFSKSLDRKKEYPHYTRPEDFRGMKVPDVLIGGHHKKIEDWRKEQLH